MRNLKTDLRVKHAQNKCKMEAMQMNEGPNWYAARMQHYKMRPAEEINQAMEALPQAEEYTLYGRKETDEEAGEYEKLPHHKTIRVKDQFGRVDYVNCPRKSYKLVQHKDAFRPIIEGLMQGGIHNFGFITQANHKKAELQVYATGEVYDTVSLGFRVMNSLDGTSAINYGFRTFRETSHIEIVGYRQACANGMKIQVPLDQAEIVKPELRNQIQMLMSKDTRIQHTKSAEDKIQTIQYIVEAISLLKDPVEEMIKRAEKWTWRDADHLEQLIKKHVGQRYKQKVEERLGHETPDLWGLYNAITYVASHDPDMKLVSRENLQGKAANMLTQELIAPTPAVQESD